MNVCFQSKTSSPLYRKMELRIMELMKISFHVCRIILYSKICIIGKRWLWKTMYQETELSCLLCKSIYLETKNILLAQEVNILGNRNILLVLEVFLKIFKPNLQLVLGPKRNSPVKIITQPNPTWAGQHCNPKSYTL